MVIKTGKQSQDEFKKELDVLLNEFKKKEKALKNQRISYLLDDLKHYEDLKVREIGEELLLLLY